MILENESAPVHPLSWSGQGYLAYRDLLLGKVVTATCTDCFADFGIPPAGGTDAASAIGNQPNNRKQNISNQPDHNDGSDTQTASDICSLITNLLTQALTVKGIGGRSQSRNNPDNHQEVPDKNHPCCLAPVWSLYCQFVLQIIR